MTDTLEPNGVQCDDCGEVFEGETECPNDPDHQVFPILVTDAPLGRPDDEDSWHYGLRRYVYTIE